jgi:hypothetical protein
MLTPAHVRGLTMVACAVGASTMFDGPALLLALGLGTATFALTAERRGPTAMPRYRLEHRRLGRARILVTTSDEATGHAALQSQAAALMATGVSGQLVLVDGTTGHAVTWQVLAPQTPAPFGAGTGKDG